MGKRWKAWAKHRGLTEKADMHVLPVAVNFMDETEITRLLYTIDKLDRQFAMVVVDTVARARCTAPKRTARRRWRSSSTHVTIQGTPAERCWRCITRASRRHKVRAARTRCWALSPRR